MRLQSPSRQHTYAILLGGLLLGLAGMAAAADHAAAMPAAQGSGTPSPAAEVPQKACTDCHPDVLNAWKDSPHAHASDDPVFQEGWVNMEQSPECFLCHKAAYQAETGQYLAVGVTCEACHGPADAGHPPAEVPIRSDEEYCGTCHPTTLGEARLSGHSTLNEVRCVDCHDPHSQAILFENPDDMCKDCHEEDLAKMDEAVSGVHLRENIPCAYCHTLDVPHTFLLNFRHEDMTPFYTGFDCASEIGASVADRAGTDHAVLAAIEPRMNWPVVHRVSRPAAALKCLDCHIMDDALRADFEALGLSVSEVEGMAWERDEYPAIEEGDLLVAKSRPGWGWAYGLIGVAAVFAIFEATVARHLSKGEGAGKPRLSLAAWLRGLRARRPRRKG
jgi:hypothetical protein